MSMMGNSVVTAKTVHIEMIENSIAHVVDQFGQLMSIPTDFRIGKGALPQVGEYWTVQRDPGARAWVFAACLVTANPEIINEVPVGSSTDEMLTALAAQGLLVDSAPRVIDWSPWVDVRP